MQLKNILNKIEKKKKNKMRKIIWLYSILLFLFSIGMLVLQGTSGHKLNFDDRGTLIYVTVFLIFLSTSILLIIYNCKQSIFVKKLSTGFNVLTILSLLYLFYEITQVKIGDFFALIPIICMGTLTLIGCRILYYLVRGNVPN